MQLHHRFRARAVRPGGPKVGSVDPGFGTAYLARIVGEKRARAKAGRDWWEFTVLHLACLKLGAVSDPLMVIFRQRELGIMLGLAESKVLVVPHSFRGFDYPAMAAEVQAALPGLLHVFVAGGQGAAAFDRLLEPAGAP